jgi:hypothetical protein
MSAVDGEIDDGTRGLNPNVLKSSPLLPGAGSGRIRMKKLFVVAACCVSPAVFALAFDSSQDFKKFIAAEELQMAQSFNRKDTKVYESALAADFKDTDKVKGQTYNKQQSLAQMKQVFTVAKSIKCSIKVVSAKAQGNTGIAVTAAHVVLVMNPMDSSGKAHTMVMDELQKETWVRVGKTWKLKMAEDVKPVKMTMDGKPIKQ